MSQIDELTALNEEYQRDCRFNSLRHEGIKFVPGSGPVNPTLMLIGEAPGRMENAKGQCFVGKAGETLNGLLYDMGMKREDVYVTNVVKYWPLDYKFFNRTRSPSDEEVEAAKDYIRREIDIVDPTIVGLCGRFAIRAIYPELTTVYHENGRLIDGRYVPLYHPAVLLYPTAMKKHNAVRDGYRKLGEYIQASVI